MEGQLEQLEKERCRLNLVTNDAAIITNTQYIQLHGGWYSQGGMPGIFPVTGSPVPPHRLEIYRPSQGKVAYPSLVQDGRKLVVLQMNKQAENNGRD